MVDCVFHEAQDGLTQTRMKAMSLEAAFLIALAGALLSMFMPVLLGRLGIPLPAGILAGTLFSACITMYFVTHPGLVDPDRPFGEGISGFFDMLFAFTTRAPV